LSVDPFETQDISGSRPDVVEKLKKVVEGRGLSCRCYQC
jgi:hypothetical protein